MYIFNFNSIGIVIGYSNNFSPNVEPHFLKYWRTAKTYLRKFETLTTEIENTGKIIKKIYIY